MVRGQQEAEQQGQDPEQVEDVVTVGSPHLRRLSNAAAK